MCWKPTCRPGQSNNGITELLSVSRMAQTQPRSQKRGLASAAAAEENSFRMFRICPTHSVSSKPPKWSFIWNPPSARGEKTFVFHYLKLAQRFGSGLSAEIKPLKEKVEIRLPSPRKCGEVVRESTRPLPASTLRSTSAGAAPAANPRYWIDDVGPAGRR